MYLFEIDVDLRKIDGVTFNPFGFGNHPERDHIVARITEFNLDRIFLVEGQNFYHLSLWSVAGTDTPTNVASSIVNKHEYVGEYAYRFLN